MSNIFYLDSVFPDSDKVFSFQHKTVRETKDSCIYVFDTNVLLVPYLTSRQSVEEYRRIFQTLKEQSRIYIPQRVAREFAKNRSQRIIDIYGKLTSARENLDRDQFKIDQFPIFESNVNYQRIQEIESQANKLKNEFRHNLDALKQALVDWKWDDPVSMLYRDIFTPDIIVPLKQNDEKHIGSELEHRNKYQIPPGFKKSDQEKPDNGSGDLIIWLTTLEIAKEHNADVIFVTNESKNDWFYTHQKTAILPRYELIDEFRRFTNGKSVNLIDFGKFLALQNASDPIVAEVSKVSKSTFDILEATYHTDSKSLDVTSVLRTKIVDSRLSLWANNEMAGDPHPGIVKKLEIVYTVDGPDLDSTKIRRRVYNEHEWVDLPE